VLDSQGVLDTIIYGIVCQLLYWLRGPHSQTGVSRPSIFEAIYLQYDGPHQLLIAGELLDVVATE
jgi:hypothetical protein